MRDNYISIVEFLEKRGVLTESFDLEFKSAKGGGGKYTDFKCMGRSTCLNLHEEGKSIQKNLFKETMTPHGRNDDTSGEEMNEE